jgi:hypothetical protein
MPTNIPKFKENLGLGTIGIWNMQFSLAEMLAACRTGNWEKGAGRWGKFSASGAVRYQSSSAIKLYYIWQPI